MRKAKQFPTPSPSILSQHFTRPAPSQIHAQRLKLLHQRLLLHDKQVGERGFQVQPLNTSMAQYDQHQQFTFLSPKTLQAYERQARETTRYETLPPKWLGTSLSDKLPASRIEILGAATGILFLVVLLVMLLCMGVSQTCTAKDAGPSPWKRLAKDQWDEESQPLITGSVDPRAERFQQHIGGRRCSVVEPDEGERWELGDLDGRLSGSSSARQSVSESSPAARRRSEARNAWLRERAEGAERRRSHGSMFHIPERSLDLEAQPL
ncbi:uncharacterized protein BCR38DRAFT_90479 [Pseudomassariella vexata]|uniref:Uncharacterized protein n=1 Tax=Pseudomassariella vexata TaxID=1141098 RepID=A0A1Y2EFX5_9PEZI|nr:uncharacterized protein BCR38DRAFT_90479 [Pseudomassariella vexata]ORY69695.1 hypothetical protein BCR38DRAFT_90479 [Pseudomassariella vexata]